MLGEALPLLRSQHLGGVGDCSDHPPRRRIELAQLLGADRLETRPVDGRPQQERVRAPVRVAQLLVERTGWTMAPGAMIALVALAVLPVFILMRETAPIAHPSRSASS